MKKEGLLSYFPKITYQRYLDLLRAFPDIEDAFNASFSRIINSCLPWPADLLHEFTDWKCSVDQEKIEKHLAQHNIVCIAITDANYPRLLKEIHDPPICLFVKGNIDNINFPVSIVGTRKCTGYGRFVAEELTQSLSALGITVISGLAFGIDEVVHRAVLKCGVGKTIAVLGSGIDYESISPASNTYLAENIIKNNGAVISEYPPGTIATKFTFPKRNRIIAGMSLGTIIIEAHEKSGALITAQCALDENREIFAVPQNINSPASAGANNLIKNGAHLITKAEDVLQILNLEKINTYKENAKMLPASKTETLILEKLSKEPLHIDEIIKMSGLKHAEICGCLTIMEMKGMVKNTGAMMYIRNV
jgi:DNA processing protein